MTFSAMQQRKPADCNRRSTTDGPKLVGQLLSELQVPDNMLKGRSFLANQHRHRKQQAQKKREAAVQLADSALLQLDTQLKQGKSDTLMHFLKTMSTFHTYSFNNQLLISAQNPKATKVAGFNNWKKHGRFVKKGETGIRILAPMLGKLKQDSTDEERVDGKSTKKVFRFRVVSVFDISQTDGKPLPSISEISGDPGTYLPKLRQLVQANGIELSYETLHGPEGISKGGSIVIDNRLESNNEFAVLAHELAHELMHRSDRRSETTKTQRETEAEAVAFVVCQAFDVDTTSRTADYIQLYRGDSALLAESLDCIRAAAADIISNLKLTFGT
ncbi:MAG: ArdC-like ssDNA-binding domain-containing protein [Planctomycetota bacterium]